MGVTLRAQKSYASTYVDLKVLFTSNAVYSTLYVESIWVSK